MERQMRRRRDVSTKVWRPQAMRFVIDMRSLAYSIPEELLRALRELDDLMWEKVVVANVYGKQQTADDRMTLFKASDWSRITDAISAIRLALRATLGDVAKDARIDARGIS